MIYTGRNVIGLRGRRVLCDEKLKSSRNKIWILSPSRKRFGPERTGSGERGQSAVSLDAIKRDRTLGSLHVTLTYLNYISNIFL